MSKFDELYDKQLDEVLPLAARVAAGAAAKAAASKLTEDDDLKTFVVITTTGDRWEASSGVVVIVAKDENEAKRLATSRKHAFSTESVEEVVEVDSNTPGIVYEQNPSVQ